MYEWSMRLMTALVMVGATLGAARAAADPGLLPQEEEVVKDEKPEGFDPKLVLGASIAVSTNTNYVGQPTGNSFTGGLNLEGRLDYLKGVVDWRNLLKINEVFTRTPVVDEFVKTADQLYFESVIYYRISELFGPFASFKLDTAMLVGRDVRGSEVDYTVGGELVEQSVTSIQLTDSFEPLSLKEAVGFFLRPISKKSVEIDLRGGFGASQLFADGALIVEDDAATEGVIELTELEDVIQAGAVAEVRAVGELEKGRITYSAHTEVMIPFLNDDPEDRSATELTNFDIGAKIGLKLFEWASLNYELKILRLPQLVDVWQIQNNLLLTFSYALID